MVEIVVAEEFVQRFHALPAVIRRKAVKQERLFRNNPFHPSLGTEKLHPKGKELWSLRVDRSYRILFRFTGAKEVIFLTVGRHDWIYQLI